MTTSQSNPEPLLIETRFVWGKTITDAMRFAIELETKGWRIQGNPAPMTYNGLYGTGVSVSRKSND
jgi:hypothetical protein